MRHVAALALALVAGCHFGAPGARPGDDAGGGGDGGGGGDDAMPVDAAPDAAPEAWWDQGWSARRRVLIDNAVPLAQGFQIGIRHDLDTAPCDGNRDAVRVVRDHTTELPRVIDEVGGDEWIWFQLAAPVAASVGSSEYWIYCGNPSPGSPPDDPAMVFDAHHDFSGPTALSGWNASGAVTASGGAVTLSGSGITGNGIHTTALYGPGTATDFILQASSGAISNPEFWGGFEIGFTFSAPWVIWYAREPNTIRQETLRNGQNPTAANEQTLQVGAHLYGVEHYGMSAGFRYENAAAGSIPYGGSIGQMNVRFHNFQSGGNIQIQMARMRKAVTPIPAATLGDVEPRP